MSATFDTVDHTLLLNKLAQCFGIREKVYDLISTYLKDRSQTVHQDSSTSTQSVLKHGVLQSLVLGPVPFLLFTREISHIFYQYNLQSQCYADDCQVHSSCKPDKKEELVQSTLMCIKGLSLWMASNRMKLNPDKIKFMWIASCGRQHIFDHISIIRHIAIISVDVFALQHGNYGEDIRRRDVSAVYLITMLNTKTRQQATISDYYTTVVSHILSRPIITYIRNILL